jgi:glycosyltransferase involved in cell wall biosynthesis
VAIGEALARVGEGDGVKINMVVPPPDLSGGWRVLATYAEQLSRRGHTVTCVSTTLPIFLRDKLRSLKRGDGWPHVLHPHSHAENMNIPVRIIKPWRPVSDGDLPDADVVMATWWETAEWVAKLSPSKGVKTYFIQHHEILFNMQPKDRVAATWRLPMDKITISQWLVDLAREAYGDPNVTKVLNSVDMKQFNAPERGKQKAPTVGMLYSTTGFKGCDVSLKAFDFASKRVPGLRLMAFGAEPIAAHLALPANTEFHLRPAPEQIKHLYAKCDAWLCGSHSEGFHLPPLEAMACRCPVVSTRIGGPMDIIEQGVNGYLTDPGDSAALADALVNVLQMPEAKWRDMSDAALAVATGYTWEDATMLLEQALEASIMKAKMSRSPCYSG